VPAYTGNNFTSFCKEFGIEHKNGIPYNKMGQGIVEHEHHTLRNWLLKTKDGELYPPKSPKTYLAFVSFVFCPFFFYYSN
jgi:transposase InsO family protein